MVVVVHATLRSTQLVSRFGTLKIDANGCVELDDEAAEHLVKNGGSSWSYPGEGESPKPKEKDSSDDDEESGEQDDDLEEDEEEVDEDEEEEEDILDDLTVIKGIGAKTAEKLLEEGYGTYKELAEATPEDIVDLVPGDLKVAKKMIAEAKKRA